MHTPARVHIHQRRHENLLQKQYAFWMAMQCVRPIGCNEKSVARFNQIFNLNEWKRWNHTTKQTFSSSRDSVVFALDCASKLDLNGGRLVLRFTCCSTRFCFSFSLSFSLVDTYFFLGVPRAKWILECFYGWFFFPRMLGMHVNV